jgi:hypothetical protein
MGIADDVQREVAQVFAGQRVVCVGGILAGMAPLVAELRAAGAERVLLIPTSVGTGEGPEGDDVEIVVDELPPEPGATDTFRAEERWAAAPPKGTLDAIRAFAGSAPLLLVSNFCALRHFGPFSAFGPRRPDWVALEDKTVNDDLFDACGVSRPPASVVPTTRAALVAAHAALDTRSGTVWAGDARGGFNGGAEYVRWVRDDASQRAAIEFFEARCDRVRVATFVAGVPCSIHGFVMAEGVSVFRPVELMTMQVDEPKGLRYCGAATYFDPPAAYRDEMRAAAARVGRFLRREVAFRGGFTVDGICGAQGWVATECNPRPGAGLGYLGACLPELTTSLMQRVVVEGGLGSMADRELEEFVLDRADTSRWGGAWTSGATQWDATTSIPVVDDAGMYRRAVDAEPADATITTGPGRGLGFVRFEPARERTPAGASLAPRAVTAFAFADRELGTAIGTLRPAVDVCQPS